MLNVTANNRSTNATTHPFHFIPPNTIPAGYISIPIAVVSILANLTLITVYFKTASLRTPFGIYVISLAVADLLQSCTLSLNNISNFLQIPYPFGTTFCAISYYLGWVLIGFAFYIHILISLNRLWAVMHPNSYRLRHNRKFACWAVVGAFLFVQSFALPGTIIFEIRYGKQRVSYFCALDVSQMPEWGTACNIVLYLAPNVLIVAIYPFIYFKVRNRVQDSKKVAPMSRTNFPNSGVGSGVTGKGEKSVSMAGTTATAENITGTGPSTGEKRTNGLRVRNYQRQYNAKRHFAILTALVLGAVFCWTPINVAYSLVVWNNILDLKVLSATSVIFFLDALLNPLMYPLASKEWRDAFRILFCPGQ